MSNDEKELVQHINCINSLYIFSSSHSQHGNCVYVCVWLVQCVLMSVCRAVEFVLISLSFTRVYNGSAMDLTQGMCIIAHFCICLCISWSNEREWTTNIAKLYSWYLYCVLNSVCISICISFCGHSVYYVYILWA